MSFSAIVYYSCPSTDGAFAAFAFHILFTKRYVNTTFVPVKTGSNFYDSVPEGDKDKECIAYFLDVTPSEAELLKFNNRYGKSIVLSGRVFDVNRMKLFLKSTPASKCRNVIDRCNSNRCSSMLAWNTFSISVSQPIPAKIQALSKFFYHINDHIKKTVLCSTTRLFMAGIDAKRLYLRYNIREYPDLFKELESLNYVELLDAGQAFIDEKNKLFLMYVNLYEERVFKHNSVRIIEIPSDYYFLVDDLAEEMLKSMPMHIVFICREQPKDPSKYNVSVRTDGLYNAAVIAREMGGGGGKMSAGFVATKEAFEKMFS